MKKVLVLGSNSFSGSHFIDLLLEKGGYTILGVSRSPEKSEVFLPYKEHVKRSSSRFMFSQIDFNTHRKKLFSVIDDFRPEYIIHFAGLVEVSSSWKYAEDYFQTNCMTTVALGNFLKEKKYLRRYVHISTPEVYGTTVGRALEDARLNPSTPYAASKAAADLFLQTLYKHFSFPVVFIRATNVYGPGQQAFRIIPKTIISIRKGVLIPLEGGGKAIKSYVHIGDVSKGELKALLEGKDGEVYHISPSSSISISDLVKLTCLQMGVKFKDSIRIVADRRGQDKAYVLDSSKLRSLSWKPEISLDDGVGSVVQWVDRYWSFLKREPLAYTHLF